MIEGVTVLSQEAIKESPQWMTAILVIGLLVIVLGFVVMFFGTLCEDFRMVDKGIVMIFVTVALLLVLAVMIVVIEVPTGRHEYKVIIDDNANFKEIYNRYNIISKEGQIYIIQDKEVEE